MPVTRGASIAGITLDQGLFGVELRWRLLCAGGSECSRLLLRRGLASNSNLDLGLSLLEGVCLTIVLMLVAERYLFSAAPTVSRRQLALGLTPPPSWSRRARLARWRDGEPGLRHRRFLTVTFRRKYQPRERALLQGSPEIFARGSRKAASRRMGGRRLTLGSGQQSTRERAAIAAPAESALGRPARRSPNENRRRHRRNPASARASSRSSAIRSTTSSSTARPPTSARSSCARSASACTWPTPCRASPPASKMGVFVMQHGPGTENAYGGVAQAYGESVPILVMPGGYAAPHRLGRPQLQLHASTCAASPSRPSRSRRPRSCRTIMRRAFTRLRSGRGGPVLVEVPNDAVDRGVPIRSDYVVSQPLRTGPDPDASARPPRCWSPPSGR